MGKKERKLQEKPKNDTFDVKSNLKKLGSSTDRNSYMGNGATADDYSSEQKAGGTVSSYQDYDLKSTFEISQLKQYQQITSDISTLKEAVHGKINQDVGEVKKDFEEKLKEKVNLRLFNGAVAAILIIGSIIFILSYQPMLNKVEDIDKENIVIKDSLKSIQFDLKHRIKIK